MSYSYAAISGMAANVMRKYCVPDTADAEPSVTEVQAASLNPSAFQPDAMVLEVEVIFHSAFFKTG